MRNAGVALGATALALVACSGEPPGGVSDRPGGDAGACRVPKGGCPCEAGQGPVECFLPPRELPNGMVCRQGTRYCRNGRWSACESIRRSMLLPDGHERAGEGDHVGGRRAPLVTGPRECNPCDPDCAEHVDEPDSADLMVCSTNGVCHSSDVAYDPRPGGVTLDSLGLSSDTTDSDGDGVPDEADDFPTDPDRWHDAGEGIFHLLPYGGPTESDPLDFSTRVTTADVYFLMDTTGSMGGEIRDLRSKLTRGDLLDGCDREGIIGAIKCTVPNAWFGVGRFEDYPVTPYGGSSDRPYQHHLDLTGSVGAAQAAVNRLYTRWGYDWPESQTQALWSIATGKGLGRYLESRASCSDADRWGYPCFRPDTIPIVVLFTDAPFHNGPNPRYDYDSVGGERYCCSSWWGWCLRWCRRPGRWEAPTWSESVDALTDKEIKVITVESSGGGGGARSDVDALANVTGSVDERGAPYTFSISPSGRGLSTAVVDAVRKLANATRYDVRARGSDNPATRVDERGFIESITALRWGPGDCDGITGGGVFERCTPGTVVDFEVAFHNDVAMPTSRPQVFNFHIEVLMDGSVQKRIPVRILVPPKVPEYPASGRYERDYDATEYCEIPPQRASWTVFHWEADTPSNTAIRFEFRAADTKAALDDAGSTGFAIDAEKPDVGSVHVGDLLEDAGMDDGSPYLRVTAVLVASGDRTETPVMYGFQQRLRCTAAE